MPTKAEHLALARQHLREVELRVQNQAVLIEMLRHDNFDSKLAEAMLVEYRKVLAQVFEHLSRLQHEQADEETEGEANLV